MPRPRKYQHPPEWMRKGKPISFVRGVLDPNVYFPDTRKRKEMHPKRWAGIEAFEQATRKRDPETHTRLLQSASYHVQRQLARYYERHPRSTIHYDDAYGLIMRRIMPRYLLAVEQLGLSAATSLISKKMLGDKTIDALIAHHPKIERPGYNIASTNIRVKTERIQNATHVKAPAPDFEADTLRHLGNRLRRTTLTPREIFVLESKYGMNGNPLGFSEIGEKIMLSRERVRQLHDLALIKLREEKNLKLLGAEGIALAPGTRTMQDVHRERQEKNLLERMMHDNGELPPEPGVRYRPTSFFVRREKEKPFFTAEAIEGLSRNLNRTSLGNNEKKILRAYFLIGEESPRSGTMPLKQMEKRFDMPGFEIRNIITRALQKLREPKNLRVLGLMESQEDADPKKKKTIISRTHSTTGALTPTKPLDTAPKTKSGRRPLTPRTPQREKTDLQKALSKMDTRTKAIMLMSEVREVPLERIAEQFRITPKEAARILEKGIHRLTAREYVQLGQLRQRRRR